MSNNKPMKSFLIDIIIDLFLFSIDFAIVFLIYKLFNFEITVLLILTIIGFKSISKK